MSLYVAGGFEGDREDMVWYVSDVHPTPQPIPTFKSNAEETDTRIWLNVCKSPLQNSILFHLTQTCTTLDYHLSMVIRRFSLNVIGSTQKRILSLSNLKSNLTNDPDLSSIHSNQLPQIFQTLYVVTGSDYTSFFSGLGKVTFMKCFFQHAEFITSGTTYPGSLSDCSLETNTYELGFLAFLRLIGTQVG